MCINEIRSYYESYPPTQSMKPLNHTKILIKFGCIINNPVTMIRNKISPCSYVFMCRSNHVTKEISNIACLYNIKSNP